MLSLALMPGGTEIWIILAVVLLLFGARKLPELARSMGSSITQFKKGLKDSDGAEESAKLEASKGAEEPASKEKASKEKVES